MNSIVTVLTGIGSFFVKLLLLPFQGLSPWVGLLVVSIVSGVVFLLVYGRVSPQKTIKRTKGKIYTNLLEAVIFRHDLLASLKAQGRMSVQAAIYFSLAVPPILVLLVPCLIILAQLEVRYGLRPLHVGESSLVDLKLADGSLLNEVRIAASDGIEVTPPVRVLETKEVALRVDARKPGIHTLKLEFPSKNISLEEKIAVEAKPERLGPGAYTRWWKRLLYPSDLNLLPYANSVKELNVSYPGYELKLGGMQLHWLVVFAVVSILTGLVAAKCFKVEI